MATRRNAKRNGDGDEIDPRRARAVELLTAGATPPAVARELGIDRVTAWRWAHEPAVAAAVALARAERRDALADDLAELAGAALATLRQLIDPEADVAPVVRLKAACAVLDRLGLTDRAAAEAAAADRAAAAAEVDPVARAEVEAQRRSREYFAALA